MYIKFISEDTILGECTLIKLKDGVIKLCLKDKPKNPYAGFKVYLDKHCAALIGDYTAYRTKYKDSGDSELLLLSTGEIYEEPPQEEILEPTPEEIAEQERRRKNDELLSQIAANKALIDATDYRIIKAYEYSMVGLESEYDMKELHKERQFFRDTINTLEEELQKIKEKEISNE